MFFSRKIITALLLSVVSIFAITACGSDSTEEATSSTAPPPDYTSEGTAASPVDITGLSPYSGVVGTTNSFYVISVTQGAAYEVNLSDMSSDVNLYLYDDDSTFDTNVCESSASGTATETCYINPSSSVLYIMVESYSSEPETSYTLTINNIGAEGSSYSPVNITGLSPYSGHVDTSISYYQSSVTMGTTYTISASDMSDDVDLYVYNSDSTFSSWVCRPYIDGTGTETCSVTASSSVMYIAINGEYSSSGASFTLSIY